METANYNMPFNFNVDVDGVNTNSTVNTEIEVLVQNFVVMPDSSIDANVDLKFSVDISRATNINLIDEITSDDSTCDTTYSMIVYFVKSGDTLWKIAKKFKSTVEDIMKVNEIENENKIYPGEQIFIPKYVCTRKEITA